MGNCLNREVQTDCSSRHASGPSKTSSKSSSTSFPSSQTFSIPSTSTAPSHSGSSSIEVPHAPRSDEEILSSSNVKAFTFSALKSTTRNFRPECLLGEGGFGCVYKGWIDEHTLAPSKPGSGIMIAIKKLKPEGFQGHKEWLREVEYLGRLHHPNLVKLIGYCSDDEDRLLVYEYMPKGSLENHLFRRSLHPLSWDIRIKVAVGAARGFAFLHESHLIFRDVKAANILLDSDFNVKLSDFGLVKDGPTGENTHVTTRVMGTNGYAAPEYRATGRLSATADIYSFGVLLLELLSGRRAFDSNKIEMEQKLVDWVKPLLKKKPKLFMIMDPRLEGKYPKKAASIVATLAFQCIGIDPRLRPSMPEVLSTLEQL